MFSFLFCFFVLFLGYWPSAYFFFVYDGRIFGYICVYREWMGGIIGYLEMNCDCIY